ncbi:MAG: DJ-1/PfpI family protein [Solirubrobacteraceae bacterium]
MAILLFDRITALDAVGPYDVLRRLPGGEILFVAEQRGVKRDEAGALALCAEHAIADVTDPDMVLVPGGVGQVDLMADGPLHEWLRAAHEHTTWTTSVCTGALVLAAAGLLAGRRATTHWLAMDELARLGARAVSERVVTDGRIVTAAGVSAGIDMALTLAARIAGEEVAQAIQLAIEYDPAPPLNAGSPQSAPPRVVDLLRSRSRFAGTQDD